MTDWLLAPLFGYMLGRSLERWIEREDARIADRSEQYRIWRKCGGDLDGPPWPR